MRRRAAQLLCASLFLLATISTLSQSPRETHPANAGSTTPLTQSSAATPIQHVFIVSIDGMKPESYTEPDAHGLNIPMLREMDRNGTSSDGVRSVIPTVTYPSHTAMVTGVNPGTHGIFTNPAWDPLNQNSCGYRWS